MDLENAAEQQPRPLFNIRVENPNINRVTFALFLIGAFGSRVTRSRISLDGFRDGITIENGAAIPKEGPAILVVAPHVTLWDPPMAYYTVVREAHRSMRMIAADYAVDPNVPQDPRELLKTGKKSHPRWLRYLISFYTNIGGPISFNRSETDVTSEESVRTKGEIDGTLDTGQILAVALQETRKKPWDPNPARIGAARIALRYPNIPIVAMGITGMESMFKPIKVKLSDRFTVAEMGVDSRSINALLDVHNRIVTETAALLSPQAAANLVVRGRDLRLVSR